MRLVALTDGGWLAAVEATGADAGLVVAGVLDADFPADFAAGVGFAGISRERDDGGGLAGDAVGIRREPPTAVVHCHKIVA
jgi:hypothetical protein